ncbi:uncharacterized protein LOC142342890 isoform X2 [Convolutriloba macropyga]|uniref:uncharacterized protein LOC142342890 isoform X2 n=1 Tax=Convolutriloba macropyga TaxID=536237 RepID=UPI003F51E0A7
MLCYLTRGIGILYSCRYRMSSSVLKRELRSKVASKLKNLDEVAWSEQSEAVCEQVLQHPKFKEASLVSIYLSMNGKEIDTAPLIRNIFSPNCLQGSAKRLFIPRVLTSVLDTKSASVMTMVELKSEQDWLTLPLNKWGFKEPPLENLENRDSLEDVVISDPGVAFGLQGSRLGHGGGYYDRYLRKHRLDQREDCYLMGLALKEQITECVPMDDFDDDRNQAYILNNSVTSGKMSLTVNMIEAIESRTYLASTLVTKKFKR